MSVRPFGKARHRTPSNTFFRRTLSAQRWQGKMRRKDQPEEHIFQHVDRIGNLLLLPIVLNQEAKRKPFSDKKAVYAKHNLRMINEVCQEAAWTLDQIGDERA